MTEYTDDQWNLMPGSLPQTNFADEAYELKQADANEWRKLIEAKDDDTTKTAMGAIKGLFDTLAQAASTAQGDRRITNIYIKELEKINKKLKACLDILLDLIAQLESNGTESQQALQQLQEKIHSAPNLNLIKTELEGLVALMGNHRVDRDGFRRELTTLVEEIKRLCEEGETLKTKMESGSGGKVSEEDGDGGGGGGNVSTTSSSTSAPIDLMGWTRSTDAQSGRPYYSCPGQDSRWDPPENPCAASTSTSRRASELQPESGIPITVEGKEYKTGYVVLREEYPLDSMGNQDRNQGKKPIFGLQRGGLFKVITKRRGGAGRQGKWEEAEVEETRIPPDINRKRKIELLKSYASGQRGAGEKSRLIAEMRKWDRDNGYLNIAESEDGVYPKEFKDIMEGGRRRRTRKKRAGWRTPEKGSPMRTLYTKENKKRKKTKKKKNKRKKRKKKGTRRRRNRKR